MTHNIIDNDRTSKQTKHNNNICIRHMIKLANLESGKHGMKNSGNTMRVEQENGTKVNASYWKWSSLGVEWWVQRYRSYYHCL